MIPAQIHDVRPTQTPNLRETRIRFRLGAPDRSWSLSNRFEGPHNGGVNRRAENLMTAQVLDERLAYSRPVQRLVIGPPHHTSFSSVNSRAKRETIQAASQ